MTTEISQAAQSSSPQPPAEDGTVLSSPSTSLLPPPPPPPQIKRRRLRACDSCRQRKIRCDNQPGPCRNCEVYLTECLITRDGVVTFRSESSPARKASSNSKRTYNPQSRKRAFTVVDQANTASNWAPGRYECDPSEPCDALSVSEPPREASILPQTHPETAQSYQTPSAHSTYTQKSEPVQGVVTIEPGQFPKKSKFAGMSSGQVLAKSAEELFKHQAPHIDVMKLFSPMMNFAEEFSLAPAFQSPLVDKETADKCVRYYFSTFHVLFPILEVQVFQRNYEAFYAAGGGDDIAQIACIRLVIALGSFKQEPSVHDLHFNAVWALYPELIARPYLSSVQAFILMTVVFMNTHKDGQAILSIGVAIRIAQSIGLHRSLAAHTHPHEKEFVSKEHSLRNCVWWACYCFDKKLCFEGGRPSGIQDEDCDADTPVINEANFSFSSLAESSNRSNFSFFLAFIGICRILSRISSRLFSRNSSIQEEDELLSRITTADSSLLAWKQSLPYDLQPDQELAGVNDDVTFIGATLLHCIYFNALLVIHRASLLGDKSPHVTAHKSPRIAASDVICLNAARSLARSVNDLVTEKLTTPIPRWTSPYAVNAVFVVFIGAMKSPLRWSCAMDLALMQSMRHCFGQNNDASAIAQFEKLLESLCSAVEMSRNRSILATTPLGNPSAQHDLTAPTPHRLSHIREHDTAGSVHVNSGLEANHWANEENLHPFLQSGDEGVGNSNFQFGDFFGDDPSSLNMQFWPMGSWGLMPGNVIGG